MPSAGIVTGIGFLGAALTRLAEEAKRGLGDAQTRAALERAGFEVVTGSPAEFARFIAAESEKWLPIVRATGATVD